MRFAKRHGTTGLDLLTLFHDYTSPASAVAVRRLERLAAEGAGVEFEGFEAVGIDLTLPATTDILAELDSVQAEAEREGIELKRPAQLPPTGLAHVLERLAKTIGAGAMWREVCYQAYWIEGRDLADPEQLRRLAVEADLPADEVSASLDDPLALAAVRRRTASHRRDGVGGVPTILSQRTLIPGLLPEDDLRALAAL